MKQKSTVIYLFIYYIIICLEKEHWLSIKILTFVENKLIGGKKKEEINKV